MLSYSPPNPKPPLSPFPLSPSPLPTFMFHYPTQLSPFPFPLHFSFQSNVVCRSRQQRQLLQPAQPGECTRSREASHGIACFLSAFRSVAFPLGCRNVLGSLFLPSHHLQKVTGGSGRMVLIEYSSVTSQTNRPHILKFLVKYGPVDRSRLLKRKFTDPLQATSDATCWCTLPLPEQADASGLEYTETDVSDATCTQYSTADCERY